MSRSFQVAQIFSSLTVHENMCAATAIAAASGGHARPGADAVAFRREPRARAEAALELFRIASYRDMRAATLPQGVRKLLDIAMAVPARRACCCSTSRPAASRSRTNSR
jgi:branched-chain amino acid transport system ATP-binding protein